MVGIFMTIGIIEAKKFIRGIGYVEPLHKVNLFLIEGSFSFGFDYFYYFK